MFILFVTRILGTIYAQQKGELIDSYYCYSLTECGFISEYDNTIFIIAGKDEGASNNVDVIFVDYDKKSEEKHVIGTSETSRVYIGTKKGSKLSITNMKGNVSGYSVTMVSVLDMCPGEIFKNTQKIFDSTVSCSNTGKCCYIDAAPGVLELQVYYDYSNYITYYTDSYAYWKRNQTRELKNNKAI